MSRRRQKFVADAISENGRMCNSAADEVLIIGDILLVSGPAGCDDISLNIGEHHDVNRISAAVVTGVENAFQLPAEPGAPALSPGLPA